MRKLDLATKLTPAETALLVIDIQKDFVAPEGLLGRLGRDLSSMPAMLRHVDQLIDGAAQHGVYTAYTQQVIDRAKVPFRKLEQYDRDGYLVTCDAATDGWHFHNLTPPPAQVFQKQTFDPFKNPDLLQALDARGIKTLVLCGVDTIYCVEATIRSAFDYGFHIVVAADAVGGNPKYPEWNQRTLDLVTYHFGVVSSTAEILEHWASHAANRKTSAC